MRSRLSLILAVVVLAGLALLAQERKDRTWQAPPETAAVENPLRQRPQLAAGGQKIFKRNCAFCHDAGKQQKGPDLSSEAVQAQPDGALFWKITQGNTKTGMPSFSSLPEPQRWQLVLFLRSLRAASAPEQQH